MVSVLPSTPEAAAVRVARPHRHAAALSWLPLVLLVIALLAASEGITGPRASAADPTSNVAVNASLAANLAISNANCNAGSVDLTIGLGTVSYSTPACRIDYGATNDATVRLTLQDSNAAPFLGTISNTTSDCAAFSSPDEAGVHIVAKSANSAIAAAWATSCTALATAGNNEKFRSVPANGSPATACESNTTASTSHYCTFEWGANEGGAPLTAGTYTGTAVFTASDY